MSRGTNLHDQSGTPCHLAPTAHLHNDKITDTDAETLDSDGRIEASRCPSLTKSQQGHTVERRFLFVQVRVVTWIRDMFQVLHRRWQGCRFLVVLAMRIPSFYCDCPVMRWPSNLSCAAGKQVEAESRSHSRKCTREDPRDESHRGERRGKG